MVLRFLGSASHYHLLETEFWPCLGLEKQPRENTELILHKRRALERTSREQGLCWTHGEVWGEKASKLPSFLSPHTLVLAERRCLCWSLKKKKKSQDFRGEEQVTWKSSLPQTFQNIWCGVILIPRWRQRADQVNAREDNTYYYNSNITHCEPGTGLNTLHSFNRPNNPLR